MQRTQHLFILLISISLVFGQYWLEQIQHNGISPFNPNPSTYKVWRNVKDYGARGDGVTDDSAAINAAITDGNRCGEGCQSSTLSPAIVYFPSGTYLLSSSIIQYYFTQLVGDPTNPPTLIANSNFKGFVIDSDPYGSNGYNWYQNQNNFYRQVRNFKIDVTRCQPSDPCTGIHWQVAQATSITNVEFFMGTQSGTTHQGIWMENGSGGFYSDLVFHGGKFGMWVGNQQFTSRNLTFFNAQTAIYMNWNWGWTLKDISINNCQVGVDISSGKPSSQTVGSIVLMDSDISNTPIGILTSTSQSSAPKTSGTALMDNVRLYNVKYAVASPTGNVIFPGGNTVIQSWGQGIAYRQGTNPQRVQGTMSPPQKSSVLLSNGRFFQRTRPQYQEFSISQVVNVKSVGCKGDGQSDDTQCLQDALNQNQNSKVTFIPMGAYLITSTLRVPPGSRIVGECWSILMATGSYFQDPTNPKPVIQVGNPGDSGIAEFSDLLFSTKGPAPGAIFIEWNIRDTPGSMGTAGIWDSHFRIGGAEGTQLQGYNCQSGTAPSSQCMGVFLMLHLTPSSSAYIENVWGWTADHDLDGQHNQVSIYTGRGYLIESAGPVWMYGTACEHNVMYQYSLINSQNIVLGMIQTETPYYQPSPMAPSPYTTDSNYWDPRFKCSPSDTKCGMAWGLLTENSTNVYVYGAGHYSFFDNYTQQCLKTEDCQNAIVSISRSSDSNIYVYNLNTVASNKMAVDNGNPIYQGDNTNGFCSTILADV